MIIIIVCPTAAFGKGGMEKVACDLANYLSKRHNVIFCYNINTENSALAYNLKSNVECIPWDISKESHAQYSKKLKALNLDISIIFGSSCSLIQYIGLFYESNVPILVAESSNPERVLNNNWALVRKISIYQAAWERELLYSQVDRIHFLLPHYMNSLPNWLKKRAVSFPNAFPRAKHSSNCESKKIINIGGLKQNKNILSLILAFKKISNKYPEWSVHVYSTPRGGIKNKEYHSFIVEKINNCQLESKFILHDEVDNIYEKYCESSIHVITSLSEGLSNAVCEAMCCGIPSIGIRNVPGVDGVIKNQENGILIQEDNIIENLSSALEDLIRDDLFRKKMGKNAFFESNQFSPENIYDLWEKTLIDTVSTKEKIKDESQYHYDRSILNFFKNNIKNF